ncbi:fasciclin domain-containing protein [Penaeicola halotolerans]|uniref:fasciclin domain-containing protein n=1 Tax=Penaeicola halotolerans TaxID=2793196 RepID=UPI001CF81F0C|nr:fasciclin domain-containing protein [Penaeicola halotolerans]
MKKVSNLFQQSAKFLGMLMIAASFTFVACNDDDDVTPVDETIIGVASSNPNFSTLVAAIQQAGLVETLQGAGPFTVFAPTNAAFEAYLEANGLTAAELLAADNLGDILTYHVLSGNVGSSALTNGGEATTVEGSTIYFSLGADNRFSINGVAPISATDIAASNGTIHVIDYVITPATQNIVEIAAGNDAFTELVAAVTRVTNETETDVISLLSGEGAFTVFAPTNAAFEALYTALGVNGIDDIDIETLATVLTYHVVDARAFSTDLRDGSEITPLQGEPIAVDLGALTVGNASLNADLLNILATNGVVHVVNDVMLPPSVIAALSGE